MKILLSNEEMRVNSYVKEKETLTKSVETHRKKRRRRRNAKSPLISVRNVHSTTTTTIRTKKGESLLFFSSSFFSYGYASMNISNDQIEKQRYSCETKEEEERGKKSSSMCYCC
jgi:hypothetical protein